MMLQGIEPKTCVYADRLHKEDYYVEDIPIELAHQLVKIYHYAKGASLTRVYTHGLFHKDDFLTCLGVAWWLPPTKAAAIASYAGDWRRVLSLSRLIVVPDVPKNAASFLLAQSVKRIRKLGAWDCLITYADEYQEHVGTIYKASNWEYMGLTKAMPLWVNSQGRMISKKTASHTRTKQEMLDLGYTLVGYYKKHKYRMILKEVA